MVRGENDEFAVTVKGTTYRFRLGDDRRLRQVGERGETDDAQYARERVMAHLMTG